MSVFTPNQGSAHWRSSVKPPPGASVIAAPLSTPAPGVKSMHLVVPGTPVGQVVVRKAGASHDATFFPPTITLLFAAEEKYVAPCEVTWLTATLTGPSWKNGSSK